MGYGPEHRKQEDKIFAAIEALDKSAGTGLQVGRRIRFQVVDGYANYIVTKILKSVVQVVHLNLLDGYTFQGVYKANGKLVLSRKVAENQLGWEDKLNESFSKQFVPLSRI